MKYIPKKLFVYEDTGVDVPKEIPTNAIGITVIATFDPFGKYMRTIVQWLEPA